MDVPKPIQVRAPYVKTKYEEGQDDVDYCDVSILAPHLTFSNLFHKYKCDWNAFLAGGLAKFWNQVSSPSKWLYKMQKCV